MRIKILVNIEKKNKTPDFFIDGYDEYLKRLSRFAKLNLIFFKEEEQVYKHLNNRQKIFVLNDLKDTISSEEFSDIIYKTSVQSNIYNEVIFIISDLKLKDIDCLDFTLSKSKLSTEMTLLILLEQIYRGYKIMNRETYHK